MIDIAIPGYGRLRLTELVSDFNGTLARDGLLLDEVRILLPQMAEKLRVHVLTGDTFGTARAQLNGLLCELDVVPVDGQAEAKAELVDRLGPSHVVAVGNGRNDRLMLEASALGIGVVGDEGIATDALQASDLVVRHIVDAFQLLLEPRRLIATLRQ